MDIAFTDELKAVSGFSYNKWSSAAKKKMHNKSLSLVVEGARPMRSFFVKNRTRELIAFLNV
jgi:hypothetical protein